MASKGSRLDKNEVNVINKLNKAIIYFILG